MSFLIKAYVCENMLLEIITEPTILQSLTQYRLAMTFGNRKKNIVEDLFSSVLSQFEKYHPYSNLKFNYMGISHKA